VIAKLRERFEVEDNQKERYALERRGIAAPDRRQGRPASHRVRPRGCGDAGRGPALKRCVYRRRLQQHRYCRLQRARYRGDHTPGGARRHDRRHDLGAAHGAARRVTEAERWLRPETGRAGRTTSSSGSTCITDARIIGMGRIGQAIARRAKDSRCALSTTTQARAQVGRKALAAKYVSHGEIAQGIGFRQPQHAVLRRSPHFRRSRACPDEATAVIVNAARGGIIDDAALVQALKERRITAAGLDGVRGEPKFNPGS